MGRVRDDDRVEFLEQCLQRNRHCWQRSVAHDTRGNRVKERLDWPFCNGGQVVCDELRRQARHGLVLSLLAQRVVQLIFLQAWA